MMRKNKGRLCALMLLGMLLFSACAAKVTEAPVMQEKPPQAAEAAAAETGTETEAEQSGGTAAAEPDEEPEDTDPKVPASEETEAPAEQAEEAEKTTASEPEPQKENTEERTAYNSEDDSEWLITLTDTSFLEPGETVRKAYGLDDVHAIVYTENGEKRDYGFYGRVLFLNLQTGAVEDIQDVGEIVIDSITPIKIGDRVIFGWGYYYSWVLAVNYYTIVDGMPKKSTFPLSNGEYLGNGVFASFQHDFEVSELPPDQLPPDRTPFGMKSYYFFWSEEALDLRAYAGVEITRGELAQLETDAPTAQRFLQEQEQEGYVLDIMYLRGNGRLDANFHRDEDGVRYYYCAEFKYTGSGFERIKDGWIEYYEGAPVLSLGKYQESPWDAEFSEAVVFPPLAAIRGAQ